MGNRESGTKWEKVREERRGTRHALGLALPVAVPALLPELLPAAPPVLHATAALAYSIVLVPTAAADIDLDVLTQELVADYLIQLGPTNRRNTYCCPPKQKQLQGNITQLLRSPWMYLTHFQ